MNQDITFFSYSRSDSEFVLKLAKELREAGAELWLDQLDIVPGTRWDVSVENALKNSGTIIVVMSDVSVASENVMDEVSYAFDSGKRIIPIQINECEIPLRLRRLQRIDFSNNYITGSNSLKSVLNLSAYVKVNPVSDISDAPMHRINNPQISESNSKKTSLNKNNGGFKKYKNYVLIGAGIGLLGFIIFLISVSSKSSGNVVLNDSTLTDPSPSINTYDNSDFYHTWKAISITNSRGEEQIGRFTKFEMDFTSDGQCQLIENAEHIKVERGNFEIDRANKQLIIYSDGDTTLFDFVINQHTLLLSQPNQNVELECE